MVCGHLFLCALHPLQMIDMVCLMRDLSGMGDDDDAPSGLSQPQEDIHDLIPGMRVEIAGRLISESSVVLPAPEGPTMA